MSRDDSSWSFAIGLFFGALTGAALASLFAPRSGPQNREAVRERGLVLKTRVNEATSTARESATTAATTVRGTANAAVERVSTTVQTVRERVGDAAERVSDAASAAAERVGDVTGSVTQRGQATTQTTDVETSTETVVSPTEQAAESAAGKAEQAIDETADATPVQTGPVVVVYDTPTSGDTPTQQTQPLTQPLDEDIPTVDTATSTGSTVEQAQGNLDRAAGDAEDTTQRNRRNKNRR
jgi:gas vesicle protein